MPRFKPPAPAPPVTPSVATPGVRKRPSNKKANNGVKIDGLSLVAAFDDLCRNGRVLEDDGSAEKEFLSFARKSVEWRRRWRQEVAEKAALMRQLADKDNELSGKMIQIKQAENIFKEERQARVRAEQDRDHLRKQLRLIQDLVFADGGKTLNNETLEKIRTLDRHASSSSPWMGGAGGGNAYHHHHQQQQQHNQDHHNNPHFLPPVEESVESLLDASDLSFDETREDILAGGGAADGSMRLRNGRSYGNGLNISNRAASKPVKRRSVRSSFSKRSKHNINNENNVNVNNLDNNKMHYQVEPAQHNIMELKEKVTKSRQSWGEAASHAAASHAAVRHVTYQTDPDPEKTPVQQQQQHQPAAVELPVSVKRTFSNASSVPNRPHSFQKKNSVTFEKCNPCGKKIKFGKAVYKCRDCAVFCHLECKKDVPLPCVAAGGNRTPTNKVGNYLADFTPIESPMIPALLVYCIKEVELRGMDDVGIYRVAGAESDANEILAKFMSMRNGNAVNGNALPRLSKYEIHAVTSCIKKFLRSLKEPVIPLSLWQMFVDAANNPDTTDGDSAMYQAISELPQPNRDTLAFIVIHLQSVAENSKVNKMNTDNLAMVMGPTIVGNSSSDPMAIMAETPLQKAVVRALMCITPDYWSNFLAVEDDKLLAYKTPTGGTTPGGGFTPEQIFATPLGTGGMTTGGPVARRTRSRQHDKEFAKRQQLFQSPMLL